MRLEIWEWMIVLWAAPMCLAHCACALWTLYLRWEPARLDQVASRAPGSWPKLSVIIPARNESETLEAALTTLLEETYPNMELVLIDDRSTDDTGRIIDRMAAFDARIRPVHIDALPEGWLGKVHALDRGARMASGEWLLFTDADVHYAKGTLERAIAYCHEGQLDFLTVMPTFERHGPLYGAMMTAFALAFALAVRPQNLGRKGSKAYMGIGAFNMVSRATYEKSEGFEYLKMEIADDIGLAYVLHRAGARAAFLRGGDALHLDWYSGVGAMVRGLEKNAFCATAHCSVLRCAMLALLMTSFVLGPIAALLQPTLPYLTLLGALAICAGAYVNLRTARLLFVPPAQAIIAPFGVLIAVYALLRSAVICLKNRGIRWRETWYSLEMLKSGQRVKL